jgi:hypothetical protein
MCRAVILASKAQFFLHRQRKMWKSENKGEENYERRLRTIRRMNPFTSVQFSAITRGKPRKKE